MLLDGRVERVLVSESEYVLILGWLADEGCMFSRFDVQTGASVVADLATSVLRHARPDVEAAVRDGAYDFGFVAFGSCSPGKTLKTALQVHIASSAAEALIRVTPELVSDKRLLDALLVVLHACQSHSGREVVLAAFLASAAGAALVELFAAHVRQASLGAFVERFRPRPVKRTFITVLFGTTEPILLQPLLFRQSGIDFGEWIYVCNSPEDAAAALRLGRLMANLYDLPITIVVLADNVGFGAANNLAVALAASDSIYLVNPDVHALPAQREALRATLERNALGTTLWGGLLFYEDGELMHAGMYLEKDTFVQRRGYNGPVGTRGPAAVELLRCEHFDKGVPFDPARWSSAKAVPAVSGAVMAFDRRAFTEVGGFSGRYIYGHYEDADLCLRWADRIGPVAIDPQLRLVHLEGQGSRARGEQYRGAMVVNRHLFSLAHADRFNAEPDACRRMRDLPPPVRAA